MLRAECQDSRWRHDVTGCQPRAQADTFQSRSLWHSPPAKLMDTICQVTSKAVTPCIETSYFSLIEELLSILCSQLRLELRVWEVDNNVVIIAGIVCPESGQAPRCELCQEFRWIPIFANDSEPQEQARGPLVSRGAGSINCQDVTARASTGETGIMETSGVRPTAQKAF